MPTNFNQDLLRIARQARGWSQTELSKHSGVSQANLSKLENGLIGPTDDVLKSVSEALGFPVDFFFQNDRVIGLPMSVQYRKRASVGQKAIERLEAELNIKILHIRRLLDAAELEPEFSLPHLDVDEYGGDPERIADLIRRTWLVPSGPFREACRMGGASRVHRRPLRLRRAQGGWLHGPDTGHAAMHLSESQHAR